MEESCLDDGVRSLFLEILDFPSLGRIFSMFGESSTLSCFWGEYLLLEVGSGGVGWWYRGWPSPILKSSKKIILRIKKNYLKALSPA